MFRYCTPGGTVRAAGPAYRSSLRRTRRTPIPLRPIPERITGSIRRSGAVQARRRQVLIRNQAKMKNEEGEKCV